MSQTVVPGSSIASGEGTALSTYSFVGRHIGPRDEDIAVMLATLGLSSLEELMEKTVPAQIRSERSLLLREAGDGKAEHEVLAELTELAASNQMFRSYIGMGYSDCITPPVILRNLLENPQWYTPYTPYQAEVAQGRLESLLNFQTMIIDLTGMEIANASLLDEGTAAAEAMAMCEGIKGGDGKKFFVSELCHPQTIEVVRARALPLGLEVIVGDHRSLTADSKLFGALVQYPATDGAILDYREFIETVHRCGGLAVVAADILSLALLTPPGEFGADIVIGNSQRFGVPLGYGGPHAAFMATRDANKRQIPGRLVGVSRDAAGRPAIRLTLQTREQHIRREKATSNICTAQALLANTAAMFAVYHGPTGIREIAETVRTRTYQLLSGLKAIGLSARHQTVFDTVFVAVGDHQSEILDRAGQHRINLRVVDASLLGISVDETTTFADVLELLEVFGALPGQILEEALETVTAPGLPEPFARSSAYLTHPVFNQYHSETEMMRYMHRLAQKDLSLQNSMIPLGSCTMKLNAAVEMIPVTLPGFGKIHPFVPLEQAQGYQTMIQRLEAMLAEITGFAGVTLQPNAGSQGEYTGLLVIQAYHQARGEAHRNVCLIPSSAHGTNPASAVMAGMRVVVVKTADDGNIDVADLRAKAELHKDDLAALMVTYPSTHGVFEESITEICDTVHQYGGQVYMDGANMNAMVGICRPGDFGPDVCHLNLHKTFCIPHGGGGPGMGPIGVQAHLVPFLPGHPVVHTGGDQGIGPVSAAPWGSPSILPISYAYISLMGSEGLAKATQVAILNANYIARRLEEHFPVLYKGTNGFVAHECILDLRKVKESAGIEVDDIAKRLADYGFHAPTVSWPVSGTIMLEPTESESLEELDRYCDALISIRAEIADIESGKLDRSSNPLKMAPHTAEAVISDDWNRPYSRERAAYPTAASRVNKYWPPVARIDNVYGDKNIVCSCLPIDAYQ